MKFGRWIDQHDTSVGKRRKKLYVKILLWLYPNVWMQIPYTRPPMSCSTQGVSLYYLHEQLYPFGFIRLVNKFTCTLDTSVLRCISSVRDYYDDGWSGPHYMIQVSTGRSLIAVVHKKISFEVTIFVDVSYFTCHPFTWWYLCYLVSTQVVESTISATATINKSCDERLDVEKRFPSLVSYFVFHVTGNLLMHKITCINKLDLF